MIDFINNILCLIAILIPVFFCGYDLIYGDYIEKWVMR